MKWFQYIFEKYLYDVVRLQIFAEEIERCWMFGDAEIPIYPVLIKKIIKWDWTASYSGKQAALVNTAKGISHFSLIDTLEEDIAVMKQD